MTSQLFAVCFDARSPRGLAGFWSGLLGWEADGATLVPSDDTGFRLRFLASDGPKTVANRMHFDLTSASPEGQRETVARAIELGARHIDVGQRPEEGHVVLADPEGNEFCVVGAGNKFLADCGFVGALSCDGSQAVGYFWARALGWPLVWDQDEETAIRSPHGGPKVSWGGPPVNPQVGKGRVHYDLRPEGDPAAELDRLLDLGATLLGPEEPGQARLADPDGNEFCLLLSAARPPLTTPAAT